MNRARRLAYGLLLSASFPASAGAELLPRLTFTPVADSTPQRVLMAGLEGFLSINAERSADPAAPMGSDKDYAHLTFESLATTLDDPRSDSALRLTVAQPTLLREGLGLDLAIPDLGALHLNLYARQDRRGSDTRAAVLSAGELQRTSCAWSLGGSMELVRSEGGARQLSFVPELSVDGSALTGGKLGFSAVVRYAHWRSLGERESQDIAVPQLLFRWKI